MRYSILFTVLMGSLLFTNCKTYIESEAPPKVVLIPKPQQIEVKNGSFTFQKNSSIYYDKKFVLAGTFISNYIKKGSDFKLDNASYVKATISILYDENLPKEGYSLNISEEKIIIKASDESGAFYGVQTLRQLLPPQFEIPKGFTDEQVKISQLNIIDHPAFRYRGMHLDVSRHFFSKEFVKEYIANLAALKMNYFHWHLTDDQGWRIEIKKYPKLSSHAAYREETLIGHYNETPQKFDNTRYGGFYTQEDIKEVVAFAAKHNVTIVPEIEMPGHAQAAISAYPELGCTGNQVPVATKWGVFEDIFCPNETTFTFLENVLSEVITLFPGEYIHIGGDEAPKTQWKKCDHCKKLIKELHLKDEHELQSYFINRIEVFLNSNGKKIIGWDEILEGGLAPNATVMSWRGTEGGIAAAKQNHNVIMTPNSHSYFDYYQAENDSEPLAIGGFIPLKKVYSFNPVPKELNNKEASYILGAQANLWTEYIDTEDKVEYMVYPRILAMSEITWSGATKDIEKEYPNFIERVAPFMKRLSLLAINYANHLYEIERNIIKQNGNIFYELKSEIKQDNIFYSLNNSDAKPYKKPIPLNNNATIISQIREYNAPLGNEHLDTIIYHKAITGNVSLNVEPHKAYSAGGKDALINGIKGSDSRYGDKEWLGFWGDDVEITINLAKELEINTVALRFYDANGQWIYAPNEVEILVQTIDGKTISFKEKTSYSKKNKNIKEAIIPVKLPSILKAIGTKIIIKIANFGLIPDGSQGAGNKAWTFIDEIIVE
jgi:hexosaminidase